jgi:uncharacterized protein YecE (DUF72 family)
LRVVVRIGTSGWSYDHWRDVLYPSKLPVAKRFSVYTQAFDTVETNSSFYHWPRESTFAGWCARAPEGFSMSVKAPRGLTHAKKLLAPETWVERIVTSWHALGRVRGILLVQLAPGHTRDDARLDYFLECLPDWIKVAVEFRHPSWTAEEVFGILEAHQASYCVMSGAGLPCILRATAPFVYVRLHGPDTGSLYAGSYSDNDLAWWADRVREWDAAGKDVFAYFNNDGDGNAVRNALTLRALVSQAD